MKQEINTALNHTIKILTMLLLFFSMIFLISWGSDHDVGVDETTIKESNLQRIYKPVTYTQTSEFYSRYDINKIVGDISQSNINNIYNTETRNYIITSIIVEEAMQQGVPVNLAFAIAKVESHFNPAAVNYNHDSADYGLFQLNNSYRNWNRSDFFDIRKNTREGVRYLKEMLVLFDGNILKAVAAYNCGPGRVLNNKIPESTEMYITKVVAAEDEFNILFNDYIDRESIVLNRNKEDK